MSFFSPDNLAQNINPWTWWTKLSDNMNGFINIVTYKSNHPETEHRITHEVAGYGMQLDVIENALLAVIGLLSDTNKLSDAQKNAFERFENLMEKIQNHKERIAMEQFHNGGIERLVNELESLKTSDTELYNKISARLKKIL